MKHGMKKNKLNRYGSVLGISVISGQKFREKPKRCGASEEMNKLIGGNWQNENGSRTDTYK